LNSHYRSGNNKIYYVFRHDLLISFKKIVNKTISAENYSIVKPVIETRLI